MADSQLYELLVLFDVDGTLVRGNHGHAQAYADALRAVHGIDVCVDWRAVQGMTDQQILHQTLGVYDQERFTPEVVSSQMASYFSEMADSFSRTLDTSEIAVCPGIDVLLPELAERKALLGLATGNIVRIARAKLSHVGISDYFRIGGFGSDDKERATLVQIAIERAGQNFGFEPALSNGVYENIFLFGDAPHDLHAGRSARVRTIGVATGVYTIDQLRGNGEYHLFETLADTERVLQVLGL